MSIQSSGLISIHILETSVDMEEIEVLERTIWPGSETDVIPSHMLLAAVHGGGLVIGAYDSSTEPSRLVGFVFGFPGIYYTADGPRIKHCSHQLGVLPEYRNTGIGFRLKRAQWQMVRHQGIDRITWTFDPLLSRNAHLNITKLGAVCNTYLRDFYGEMRDEMNQGLPSDRFEVDWWVNTRRVERRLSKRPRRNLRLQDFQKADALFYPQLSSLPDISTETDRLVLVEIPANLPEIKDTDRALAMEWRMYTRSMFENLFEQGYLIIDFVYETSIDPPRSFYVLSHGEATL